MLTDNITTTQTSIVAAVVAYMESTTTLPERITIEGEPGYMVQGDYDQMISDIRDGWEKFGNAIALAVTPIMAHIKDNAEIGTVKSDVTGATATQNNTGTGLIE